MNLTFDQMYQELSKKHRPHLEAIRNSIKRKLWVAGAFFFFMALLGLWFFQNFGMHILVFISMLFLLCMHFLKRPYVRYFRENVAKSFVALVDESLSYSPEPPNSRLILSDYHIPGFDGSGFLGTRAMRPVSTVGSPGLSNYITGRLDNKPFYLCCMSLDATGNKDKTKFKGLFVSMKAAKPLNGFIKAQRKIFQLNILGSGFIPKSEAKKMDSPAFERDFSVGSNDQITAMKYLTADVMELLINFKNELIDVQTRFDRSLIPQNPNHINLDFFWRGDEIYMRIGNKKMFKPTLRDPMCKDSLACCFSSLSFATKFNQIIAKSIEETAI